MTHHSTTSHPARFIPSRDDMDKCTAENKQRLEEVTKQLQLESSSHIMVAMAFLLQGCSVRQTVLSMQQLDSFNRRDIDVASVIGRYSYTGSKEKRCIVCLEDGRGGCARDKLGRPIMVQFGNLLDGDCDSWIEQTLFTIKRCSLYHAPQQLPNVLFVFDLKDDFHLFWPNPKYFSFVFTFPHTMTVCLCGVTPAFRRTWGVFERLIPATLRKNYILCEDYSILATMIDRENMLPRWDTEGQFDFSLDRYRSYLKHTLTPSTEASPRQSDVARQRERTSVENVQYKVNSPTMLWILGCTLCINCYSLLIFTMGAISSWSACHNPERVR